MQALNSVPDPNTMGYQVELFISCKNLKDLDLLSKSDPSVILYCKQGANPYTKHGQTEVIKDNLNPTFQTTFTIFYQFEIHQNLKFEIIDVDSPTTFDMIGVCETSLGAIVGSSNFTFTKDILKPGTSQKRGQLIVNVTPVQTSQRELDMKISCTNITGNAGCCGFLDEPTQPQFDIKKPVLSNAITYFTMYSSEKYQTLNPSFRPVKLNLGKLCGDNLDVPIQIQFNSQTTTGKTKLGYVEKSINELMKERQQTIISSTNNHRSVGAMNIERISVIKKPTFLQYLQDGWQIRMTVAIDFTGSNGEPQYPYSLHYLGGYNQYEHAIQAVGSILECYDATRNFPVYGFGGIPRYQHKTAADHCFPLNGNYDNPEIFGVEGILQAYRQMLPQIQLSGPTYFNYILSQMAAIVQSRSSQPIYNVLLILTDGEIHDMPQTVSQIVKSSTTPLSIIIIGVGNEKFKLMKRLDGDNQVLRDDYGNMAVRDIVQFVKFKKYSMAGAPALAQEVLKEVPDQLVGYMLSAGIYPNGFQKE